MAHGGRHSAQYEALSDEDKSKVDELDKQIAAYGAEEQRALKALEETREERRSAIDSLAANLVSADDISSALEDLGITGEFDRTDGVGTVEFEGIPTEQQLADDSQSLEEFGKNVQAVDQALFAMQQAYAHKCGTEEKAATPECQKLAELIAALEIGNPADTNSMINAAINLEREATAADAAAAAAAAQAQALLGNDALAQRAQAAADAKARQDALSQTLAQRNFLGIAPPPSFAEQCFLLTQLYHFVQYKREVLEGDQNGKRLPYQNTTDANPDGLTEQDKQWADASNFNASLQCSGDPFGYMNLLTQYPGYGDLLNMKTHEIANLQPMIRLYKIIEDNEGKESQLEIPFNSYFTTGKRADGQGSSDLSLFTETRETRGVGVGIQDFTFSYEADNPFAVKKSIKAKLTMFANNFSELMRSRYVERESSDGTIKREEFKYIDLALKTGRSKSLSATTLDPKQANTQTSLESSSKLNFRLKAVVGWAHHTAWSDSGDASYNLNTISPEVKTALYNSFVTLNLTPTIHDFDIDDQGRVKFSIAFLAYVEDFFDQPNFNIFPPKGAGDDGEKFERKRVVREIKAGVWAAKCDGEQLRNLREEQQEEIEDYKIQSFQALMGQMFAQNKIRYMPVSAENVMEWRSSPITFNAVEKGLFVKPGTNGTDDTWTITNSGETTNATLASDVEAAIAGQSGEDVNNVKLAFTATGAITNEQTLTFFYVSDLMDIILQGISQKYGTDEESIISQLEETEAMRAEVGAESGGTGGAIFNELLAAELKRANALKDQFKKFRLLLGPLEIVKQDDWASDFPSLGDLPVAVSYFIEWVSKKMSDRDEVYYPLPKFLNDFFNDLVREYLNSSDCFGNQAKQRTTVSQAAVTSYRDSVNDPDEITQAILWWRKDGNGNPRPRYGRVNTRNWINSAPMLNISADRDNPIADGGVEKETNWLTYYAGRSQPVERMKGDEETDHAAGIFHYGIGRDRGITKTIKLKKTDSTGLKEVRFEQEGYDGLAQLREVFDVDISTYANVNAFPGCYIYVDPIGFDPSADKDVMTMIGIGGYHMIIRSEHSFGPGRADSRIHAKWVASTDARVTRNFDQKGESTSTANQPPYCFQADEAQQAREQNADDGDSWTSKIADWMGIGGGT